MQLGHREIVLAFARYVTLVTLLSQSQFLRWVDGIYEHFICQAMLNAYLGDRPADTAEGHVTDEREEFPILGSMSFP